MLFRDHPLMMYRRHPIGRLFGYARADTINTRKAKSEPSRWSAVLICNRLIAAFYISLMKDQSILAVSNLITRRSVIK